MIISTDSDDIKRKDRLREEENGMDQLVKYLESNITDKMAIEDIVRVFEEMCQIPVENDMILFETGTYNFTGVPLFYVSFVRQFPNDEEEYFQVHVDIQYEPTDENQAFQEAVWNEDLNENIFDYIRTSQAFSYAKRNKYIRVEIYIDET